MPTPRMATIDQLLSEFLPNHISPLPSRRELRSWLDRANVARFKPNPTAKRGGGTVYYSIAGVEKFLKMRTMGKL